MRRNGTAGAAARGMAWARMATSSAPEPRALGVIIALLSLIGAVIGIQLGQASIGLIAGFGLGAAIALLFWLVDRRRD